MKMKPSDRIRQLEREVELLRCTLADVKVTIDRVEELESEVVLLRNALVDATSYLTAAVSAYKKFASKHKDIKPRAVSDPFFTTRVKDFEKAAQRARNILIPYYKTDKDETQTS